MQPLRPAEERLLPEKPNSDSGAGAARDDMLDMIRSQNFSLKPADAKNKQTDSVSTIDNPSSFADRGANVGPEIVPSVAEIMERARKIREAVEDSDEDDDFDDDFSDDD